MSKIFIPDWFINGMTFTSKWINHGNNVCTLLSYNPDTNLAEVKIITPESVFTEDGWDLQHTIWGFERREYSIITKKEIVKEKVPAHCWYYILAFNDQDNWKLMGKMMPTIKLHELSERQFWELFYEATKQDLLTANTK